MIKGVDVAGGIKIGAEGQPVAAVTIEFDDIGIVELPTPAAVEFGMTLIHNARGADDLLSFIQVLEAHGLDQNAIQSIVTSLTGEVEQTKPKLDVVTDPGLVQKVNK